MMHFNTKASKFLCLALISGSLAACSSGTTAPGGGAPSGGGGGSTGGSSTISSGINALVGGVATDGMNPGTTISDTISDSNGNLVAYAAGGLDGAPGVTASSGVASGYNVGTNQNSGSASYSGTYGISLLNEINLTPTTQTFSPHEYTGSVTLTADFDAGTLTGSGSAAPGTIPSEQSDIAITGTMAGFGIAGTVVVDYIDANDNADSITGTLSGIIGTDHALGVFHGDDTDTTMAGGFLADAD